MSYQVRLLPHDKTSTRARHSLLPLLVRPLPFTRRRSIACALFASLLAAAWAGAIRTRAQSAPSPSSAPGALSDGTTLLPNGWRIQPAGRHVRVGDMPLNLLQTPDSRYMIVTSNGLARPSFSIVDIASWSIKSTMLLEH